MIVVILNGPPGSGKDTLARELTDLFENIGDEYFFFKKTLYEEAYKWMVRTEPTLLFENFLDRCQHEQLKEQEIYQVNIPFKCVGNTKDTGKTVWSARMILQHVSENIIKPHYGASFFGDRAVEALESVKDKNIVFFSDGGFRDEIDAVAAKYPTVVVNLYRSGKSFAGDSRAYVTESDAHRTIQFINDGSIGESTYQLAKLLVNLTEVTPKSWEY